MPNAEQAFISVQALHKSFHGQPVLKGIDLEIALLKDSSLVSVITMVELTKVYGQFSARYYDYFGIGILAAGMYLLIGLPFVRLSRLAEKRFAFDKPKFPRFGKASLQPTPLPSESFR